MKVDIKKVIGSKSPALARLSLLVNYLRRTVHEEEINRILDMYGGRPSVEFIRLALREMGITYEAVGLERLDPAGRYLFAANHPFGGLDGLMLAEKVAGRFGDVRVVVNDLLMNIGPLRDIFIPVNKHGRQSVGNVRAYNDAMTSDIPVITFPAGLCSRRRGGMVCDLEWKPSFVRQAISTQRDVVPVFFDGRLSGFFYRLSNFRRAVGVKANIEMLYLADEMFRQRGSHFRIVIGDPVRWQTLDDGRPAREHARELKDMVYGFKE
ncbi:MAG: acyltransferase [Rikenellaceae bacterium]|nr:acyltransferase [Rikenellaceae bacterium]MCL2692785.1 acyltransferase [Rikenellaceae bacterium]